MTAHYGFTLADLTAYNDKHNDANGEGGADGIAQLLVELRRGGRRRPRSTSCAACSGATSIATLLLSQAIPMLLGGDEMARTRRQNKTYCQDNEISWFDWEDQDAS